MNQTNGTEKVLSEEEYDYREVSGDATSAWEYLDSCSDGEIVALADYARRQAAKGPQTRRKAIILPVLQDFCQKALHALKSHGLRGFAARGTGPGGLLRAGCG